MFRFTQLIYADNRNRKQVMAVQNEAGHSCRLAAEREQKNWIEMNRIGVHQRVVPPFWVDGRNIKTCPADSLGHSLRCWMRTKDYPNPSMPQSTATVQTIADIYSI